MEGASCPLNGVSRPASFALRIVLNHWVLALGLVKCPAKVIFTFISFQVNPSTWNIREIVDFILVKLRYFFAFLCSAVGT